MSPIWQMTPSTPSNICEIVRVNISGADEMPKVILLNANLPCGVMNVVRSLDSSYNGNCQNPLFASSFENTDAFPSFAKYSSTYFIGWTSLLTALFSCVSSTHILILPFCFGTTTIHEHQSVGCVALEITPWSSIRFSSSSTLGSKG